MSNYVMKIDFFGNTVRAETGGPMVSLNDLFTAGNAWRLSNGKAAMQMQAFLLSVTLREYIEAASKEWGLPVESFIVKIGKGKFTRTMAHLSIAMLAAEQISPEFHVRVHRTFIEGKLLEFREMGGTEFKELNAAIDLYLPGREGKDDNQGVFIQAATRIRKKLLGADAVAGDWAKASVAQTHSRYEVEKALAQLLRLGLVRDWDHLKEIIERI